MTPDIPRFNGISDEDIQYIFGAPTATEATKRVANLLKNSSLERQEQLLNDPAFINIAGSAVQNLDQRSQNGAQHVANSASNPLKAFTNLFTRD